MEDEVRQIAARVSSAVAGDHELGHVDYCSMWSDLLRAVALLVHPNWFASADYDAARALDWPDSLDVEVAEFVAGSEAMHQRLDDAGALFLDLPPRVAAEVCDLIALLAWVARVDESIPLHAQMREEFLGDSRTVGLQLLTLIDAWAPSRRGETVW